MTSRLVRQVPVTHRRLITITADDKLWAAPDWVVRNLSQALVRLYPPPGITDEALEAVKQSCLKQGAASVRVMPRPQNHSVLKNAPVQANECLTARQTVMRMIQEANASNKAALSSLCAEVMDKVGL